MSATNNNPLVINQLPISMDIPKTYEAAQEILSLYFKRIANVTNTKTGGLYSINEQGNSQRYNTTASPQVYDDVYRKCFNLIVLNAGNITASSTVAFPHNINGLTNGTFIYANCTDTNGVRFTVTWPYVTLDDTNINFTNPEAVDLTYCTATTEYLKT